MNPSQIDECFAAVVEDVGSLDVSDLLGAAADHPDSSGSPVASARTRETNVLRRDPRVPVPERDRDQSVEQMLRRVMSDDVPAQETCVDGETIAAWSEGSLRAAEASAVEQHVAGLCVDAGR